MFEDYGMIQQNSESAKVDIGPLIDMVFILLIFFVITTNFTRQTGVDVSKPKAKSAVSQGQKTMLIGITREGTLHIYGRQVSIEKLKALVSQEITKRPDASIVIVADQNAVISRVVEVMDNCTMAGARQISIAAENN
jgi:biopolymer transport protein ExbD